MKIPSLFRTPGYQRFNIEPRYYDPLKEQVQERESRIKQILEADKKGGTDFTMPKSTIQGAFTRGKIGKNSATSMSQLIIMILLSGLIFGYMYFGNIAIFLVLMISSVLLYLKMKRIL